VQKFLILYCSPLIAHYRLGGRVAEAGRGYPEFGGYAATVCGVGGRVGDAAFCAGKMVIAPPS
jgi:hypothetical protein